MFRNKKAQSSTMTLEHLVNILLGVAVFIFIVSFLVTIYLTVTTEEKDTYESDFKRVKQDLNAISSNIGAISTPLFTNNIEFRLSKIGSKPIKGCAAETICLCYKTKDDLPDKYICENLNKKAKDYEVLNDPKEIAPTTKVSIAIHNSNEIFIG